MFKNKEVLSSFQAFSIVALFHIATATLFIVGLSAKLDVWFAILLALVAATIILCIYSRLLSILPEKNFYETLEALLGRPITVFFILLLTWFAFDLGQIVLTDYAGFIAVVGLSETPFVIISLSMVLLAALSVKFGLEVLGRCTQLCIIPIIGFLVFALLISTKYINLKDLQPFLYEGFRPVLKAASSTLALPFTESVVFLLVFPAFKTAVSPYKIFLPGVYVGGIILILISTVGVLTFGPNYSGIIYYPVYELLSVFKIGTFISRMEVLTAGIVCISYFLKIAILLFGSCKGFAYILKTNDYRLFAFPVALMMVNFNLFSFNDLRAFKDFNITSWPFITLFFEIIIPVIIFILVEIQYRRLTKKRPTTS
jgi:spore germination protein KB